MGNEFTMLQRVYIEDTDAGGIVYYVNYMKFMERARTEFLRSKGFPKPAIIDDGLLIVVASAEIAYRKPARLDDHLLVSARVAKIARSYLVFEQNIYRAGEVLTTSTVKLACVSQANMRPKLIPERLRAALNAEDPPK